MKEMTAWLPGMPEPTEEAQRLVHKLSDGQSFWISQQYLEQKAPN
jgi:hypothetical protein